VRQRISLRDRKLAEDPLQSGLEDLMSYKACRIFVATRFLLLALILSPAACKNDKPSIKTFATLDEAGSALVAAAKSGDQNALLAILGANSKEVISSGDPVQDKNIAARFATGYAAMHRWRKMPDGSQILLTGYDSFPFPIPLRKNNSGQWFFDTAAGKEEILNRRIGRNELAVIDICEAAMNAQAQYFSQLHDGATTKQYAQKFISDPGKHNGLYWSSPEDQPQSPLGPLAAFATEEGYTVKPDAHTPFHGYYFHMLKGQSSRSPGGAKKYVVDGQMINGFAFVAYPAQYGNSGMMTFIINQDGVLLQKDLGKSSAATAIAMTEFDPDKTWTVIE
jgi:hypothetical protein